VNEDDYKLLTLIYELEYLTCRPSFCSCILVYQKINFLARSFLELSYDRQTHWRTDVSEWAQYSMLAASHALSVERFRAAQALIQADSSALKEALNETRQKVDSFRQRNDDELQSIRDLIEVRISTFASVSRSLQLMLYRRHQAALRWRGGVVVRVSDLGSKGPGF